MTFSSFIPHLSSFNSVQHFSRVLHDQNPLRRSSCPFLRIDGAIIGIAQVDALANLFRDARRECHLDAGYFDAGLRIE